MGNYDYKEGKMRIKNILDSSTKIKDLKYVPNDDSVFTYENGVRAWVGALFVDIRDSSSYFKTYGKDIVARVMRAFCNEIIEILRQNDCVRQIGIRGDCVYAIYSTPYKQDLYNILNDATAINTFHKMFKLILQQNSYPKFDIGIGLGASKDLVIKAGEKGSGVNDFIWIGNAVINASHLSQWGKKNGYNSILMDSIFYSNVADCDKNIPNWFIRTSREGLSFYHGDLVFTEWDNWIKRGMKNE